jgi:hypothetical protein
VARAITSGTGRTARAPGSARSGRR